MTPPNPLVAAAVNTSSPLQGAFLLEDGEALVSAIRSGDWVSGGFAAFGAVMDTVAAVSDPLGSLIAAGLGWLMEHLQPLKGWLNDLTGDSGQVAGFAQTWTNVGSRLRQLAQDLGTVLGDLDAADGAAVRAYLVFQRDVVAHLRGAASWADGLAVGMQMASTIVQVVHDLVRDSLAQLVGSLISYAAELVFSLGLATPLVIEQASMRVSALVGRFAKKIPDLVAAVRKLGDLVEKLKALFTRFGDTADSLLKGGKHGPDGPSTRNRRLIRATLVRISSRDPDRRSAKGSSMRSGRTPRGPTALCATRTPAKSSTGRRATPVPASGTWGISQSRSTMKSGRSM